MLNLLQGPTKVSIIKNIPFWFNILTEAPVEEISVVKRDGKLYADAFDDHGRNAVLAGLVRK